MSRFVLTPPPLHARAYTLVEVLVVVTVLGIAATMVVPAFSQTNTLRLQGAVRTIVADITQAQSDAVAMQSAQGIEFHPGGNDNFYIVAPVVGSTLDTSPDVSSTRRIGGDEFGQAKIQDMHLTNNCLYFDELGGPVTTAGGHVPAGDLSLAVAAGTQGYNILIEAYTGRVTVVELEAEGNAGH